MAPHAGRGDIGIDDGGEAGYMHQHTKGALVSESEELLLLEEKDLTTTPRFLQAEKRGAWYERLSKKALFFGQVVLLGLVVVQSVMLYRSYALAAALAAELAEAGVMRKDASVEGSLAAASGLPDYLVTKPMLLPGERYVLIVYRRLILIAIDRSDSHWRTGVPCADKPSTLRIDHICPTTAIGDSGAHRGSSRRR